MCKAISVLFFAQYGVMLRILLMLFNSILRDYNDNDDAALSASKSQSERCSF